MSPTLLTPYYFQGQKPCELFQASQQQKIYKIKLREYE